MCLTGSTSGILCAMVACVVAESKYHVVLGRMHDATHSNNQEYINNIVEFSQPLLMNASPVYNIFLPTQDRKPREHSI